MRRTYNVVKLNLAVREQTLGFKGFKDAGPWIVVTS